MINEDLMERQGFECLDILQLRIINHSKMKRALQTAFQITAKKAFKIRTIDTDVINFIHPFGIIKSSSTELEGLARIIRLHTKCGVL
jgi:hypothetical protein